MKKKRLIWAVDPFQTETPLQASTIRAIQTINANDEFEIEPVYYLNEYPSEIPVELPPTVIEEASINAQKKLNYFLAGVELKNILPLQVLTGPGLTQRKVAENFIQYAKEVKAELIVVSSHAKRGLQAWFLGSFSENLILYSDIPVFIVNPAWKSKKNFKHILFPTDFSEESSYIFKHVIALAKTLGSDIIVYHRVLPHLNPAVVGNFTLNAVYLDAISQEVRLKQEIANGFAEVARAHQVKASTYIDESQMGSTAQNILSFAKGKSVLIAMISTSGKFITQLLGGTTRNVVRGSTHPVWVIHPSPRAEELKKTA